MATRCELGDRGNIGFDKLPQEILNMIARYLPYKDLLQLQSLNKSLHHRIQPRLASEESKIALVMKAEKEFERNFHMLGCYICFRVLERRRFAMTQHLKDPFVFQLAGRPANYLRRFCIHCGLRKGYHTPGEILETRDKTILWVCECRQVKDKATQMLCEQCDMFMPLRKMCC